MPTIPIQLPIEILDKYTPVNNSFLLSKIKNPELDKYDGKPKDELNVIVGDDKETDFIPQVKLCRWSNEVNFSVRLKHNKVGVEKVETIADKIKWSKGNIDIEFYDYAEGEGGYKMVWYLKKKPATNKVEFSFQSKGLDFFYQPELTPEEIAQGCVRPENVVGSYAVYHSTKGGMVDANGKEYKTGKAFHIYRPHLIDAEGKEAWGILKIENGIYSVEIPQEFLDTAKFPIFANDTFGYSGAAATALAMAGSAAFQGLKATPALNGTATSISGYFSNTSLSTNGLVECALYENAGSFKEDTGQNTIPGNTGKTQYDFILDTTQEVLAGTYYNLTAWAGYFTINCWFDTGVSGDSQSVSLPGTFPTWPASPIWVNQTRLLGFWSTYTPAGGGTVVKDLIQCGIIAFPR